MPSPRHTQIDIEATPYYHCISRCVRRAFLCGDDRLSGRNFDHRKTWLVSYLAELAEVFAVRICAYAVLSNHFHLVVHIDFEQARAWSEDEVVDRYTRLFRTMTDPRPKRPAADASETIRCWRARLADLSWFMRCLNESIARRANQEDDCTGRFWEGRFRCQALLDLAGLLTCMSYVDLNPVRAGIAASLEDSEFTSIRQRLEQHAAMPASIEAPEPLDGEGGSTQLPALVRFAKPGEPAGSGGLPVEFGDYVALLIATGAALRSPELHARLPGNVVGTLERAGINSDQWLETIRTYRSRFFAMVGSVQEIDVYCARTDRDHAKGSRWAARAFRACA